MAKRSEKEILKDRLKAKERAGRKIISRSEGNRRLAEFLRKDKEEAEKTKRTDPPAGSTTKLTRREEGSSAKPRLRGPAFARTRIITKNGIVEPYLDTNAKSAEAIAELEKQGYSTNTSKFPDIVTRSESLMMDLGFIPVDADELSPGLENMRDFTLIGSENIDETIKNSKIVDPDVLLLTPVKTKPVYTFKNKSDPFYTIDEEGTSRLKKRARRVRKVKRKPLVKTSKKLAVRARKSRNKMLKRRIRRFPGK